MEKLMTFDEVIEKTSKPRLLLGNGFSMDYDKKRFSFTSLLELAVKTKIIKKNDLIFKVFEKLKTSDFESVMKLLNDSVKIIEAYKGDKKLVEKINEDSEQLKSHLVNIITNNHPETSTDIPDANKKTCVLFLDFFKDIYTLNYDLLLYWATMVDPLQKFSDGFGENDYSIHEEHVIYKNKHGGMRVHYLHGGLHIFDAGDEIIKKTYSKTGVKLVNQIKENLDKNIYPIFISEGDSKQKLTKILHNSYLNHCYKSLRSIGGDLVILGTQLKKNDNHILEAIIENNVENIYIGVVAPKSISHIRSRIDSYNIESKKRYGEKAKKKNLYLYDYRTVNIWGK